MYSSPVLNCCSNAFRTLSFSHSGFSPPIRTLVTSVAVCSSTKSSKKSINELLLKMNTQAEHVKNLKAGRQAKKEKAAGNYPAGNISMRVLGAGTEGGSSSLYLFADQNRYLFNCGEGTQRLANEHKQRLSKLENIFITSKRWAQVGGLPGCALTIQDIGVPKVTLHGPPGLDVMFSACSKFVLLDELYVDVADCMNKEYFEDHILRVDYVPVFAEPSSSAEKDAIDGSEVESLNSDGVEDYYSYAHGGSKRKVEVVTEHVGAKKSKFDTGATSFKGNEDCVMCYICTPKRKQGRLLIEKCLQHGVPTGPLLGKLKEGHDVTLPNGKVVKASDVREPDFGDVPFIVVDCPTKSYLKSFLESPKWDPYTDLKDGQAPIKAVFHFTPTEVYLDEAYQKWMERFGTETDHVLNNDSSVGYGHESVHRLQRKLNMIDSKIFPLLYHEKEPTRMPQLQAGEDPLLRDTNIAQVLKTVPQIPPSVLETHPRLLQANTLLKYMIRPPQGASNSNIASLCMEDYVQETLEVEGFSESIAEYKKTHVNSTGTKNYPRVLFTGTGSCIPNKARNVSGILVEMDESSRMMLDCGEGTVGQLYRFFGPDRIDEVLKSVGAVYISHLHADHHLGLVNLLQARKRAFDRTGDPLVPVALLAPWPIKNWLQLYHKFFEPLADTYRLYPNGNFMPNAEEDIEPLLEALNVKKISTCFVRHCAYSYGVAIEHRSGWKLSYSGDTKPCDSFVTIGLDSDICIHEATIEDELAHEANRKQHSTTSQAIGIGNRMKAKFILLTHFSQRYAKVPKIDVELAQNVGLAFDNMLVGVDDLPRLPSMYPVLKALFVDELEDMESKTKKKLKQLERKVSK